MLRLVRDWSVRVILVCLICASPVWVALVSADEQAQDPTATGVRSGQARSGRGDRRSHPDRRSRGLGHQDPGTGKSGDQRGGSDHRSRT